MPQDRSVPLSIPASQSAQWVRLHSRMSGGDEEAGVWVAGVILLLCALGVVFNMIVIGVVVLTPTIRSSTDIFIVNLSVSGVLLAGLAMPLKLTTAFYSARDFYAGDVGCKLTQFVPHLTIMSAISTMTAISFDRYFAITGQWQLNARRSLFVIGGIWIISVATSAPQIYEYSTKMVESGTGNDTFLSCGSHDIPENFETIYASVILAVSYVIPLLLIAVNYIRVVVFLYRVSRTVLEPSMGQGGYQVSRSKVKVLRMVVLLTPVFAVLWVTYFVLFCIEEITDTDSTVHVSSAAHVTKHVTMALSTISNPILYAAYTKTFQDRLASVCICFTSRTGRGTSGERYFSKNKSKPIQGSAKDRKSDDSDVRTKDSQLSNVQLDDPPAESDGNFEDDRALSAASGRVPTDAKEHDSVAVVPDTNF